MLSSCKRGARGPKSQSNWSSCYYFSVSAPVSHGYYYSSAYSFLFPLPESRGCVSFLPDTLPHSKRHTSTGKIFTKHLQTLPIALEEHECNSNLKHHLPFLNFSSSHSLQVTHNIRLLKASSLSTWSGTFCFFLFLLLASMATFFPVFLFCIKKFPEAGKDRTGREVKEEWAT